MHSRSQRQGDVAFDNFGPQQLTAPTDLVVTHPTAATSSYRTGQSGAAAARQEAIKEGKYSEVAAAKGIRFIPFAMETYGKLGTKALRLLRTLGHSGRTSPTLTSPLPSARGTRARLWTQRCSGFLWPCSARSSAIRSCALTCDV